MDLSIGLTIHPEIEFVGPLASLKGKQAVVEAAEQFIPFFDSITIRTCLSNGQNEMIAYAVNCPMPIGKFSAAALMDIEDGLIKRLELFYDARPFEMHQNAIFSK